jgi:hypothetical protein
MPSSLPSATVLFAIVLLFGLSANSSSAQDPEPIYDEAKVPSYSLPHCS